MVKVVNMRLRLCLWLTETTTTISLKQETNSGLPCPMFCRPICSPQPPPCIDFATLYKLQITSSFTPIIFNTDTREFYGKLKNWCVTRIL